MAKSKKKIKRWPVYVRRENPFRMWLGFATARCACCYARKNWVDIISIREDPYGYRDKHFYNQRVCNKCATKSGIKHEYDEGWMLLRDDVN